MLDCSQVSMEAHCDTLAVAGPNTNTESIVSSKCETDGPREIYKDHTAFFPQHCMFWTHGRHGLVSWQLELIVIAALELRPVFPAL
jgi:hypothetical protein